MARIARVVAPGFPHHVTQRGNRRQQTFFKNEDYDLYIKLMAEWCAHFDVLIWAYCLMPNHVHLIAVPSSMDGLRGAIGEAHRRYTRHVNFREGWRGHLWQGRFASYVMDEPHALAAARYVEMNPVRAGLVKRPQDYPWSSAAAHISGIENALVAVSPLSKMIKNWERFLLQSDDGETAGLIKQHDRTGRPVGSKGFLEKLERKLNRSLFPQKRGPKPK